MAELVRPIVQPIELPLAGDLRTDLGGASIPDRPYPTYPEYVLADLSQKSKLFNNGAAGYNNVTDVSDATNPYGLSNVAQIVTPTTNTDQFLLPLAALSSPLDCSGEGSFVFEFKPVSNLGKPNATNQITRFDVQVHSAGAPGAATANFHRLNSGATATGLLRNYSTADDNATAGRWGRVSWPKGMMVAAGSGSNWALTWAQVQLRSLSGQAIAIESGKITWVPNPRAKGMVLWGREDLRNDDNGVFFALAQSYGCPLTLWPGAYMANLGQSGFMTEADVKAVLAAGGYLANQAVWTEVLADLLAQNSATRLANIDAMFAAQRASYGVSNLDAYRDGSYHSTFTPSTLGPVYDDYKTRYRTLRGFYDGSAAGPPLPWGETFPVGDRYNIRCLNAESGGWSDYGERLIAACQFAADTKSIVPISMHTLSGKTALMTGIEAAMSWCQSNSAIIERGTMERLNYG